MAMRLTCKNRVLIVDRSLFKGIGNRIKMHDQPLRDFVACEAYLKPDNGVPLVNFDRNGTYSSPEFIWLIVSGAQRTQILNSDSLGEEYENDMFVGGYMGKHLPLRFNKKQNWI